MNSVQNLPNLGVGIGFREQFRADLFLRRPQIDFLEITADHYLDATAKKNEELELLRQHFPIVPHGLNLSLGSAEGVDEKYLEKLAALLEKLRPAWFSEHICFTKSGGVDIGHLAPVPLTRESLEVLKRNVFRVKEFIKTPLILENITYTLRFPFSEIDEAEFIGELIEETDCGLLLDVTNLYINSVNHQYDWREFLEKLPPERIVQLHFVGSHRHGDVLLDAHADRTEAEIWNVFREVCVKSNIKGAILERDENFPPFAEILEELAVAKSFLLKDKAVNFSG
jgi:uncharacterized protein